jgi:DNA-binding MarR family transcriptional regulator
MPEYVGTLIASARRRIKQAVLARVARHGLSAQQFWFLVAVAERSGTSQSELRERLRIDAPTTSRVFATLERLRLVKTRTDAEDRRRICVSLTPEGARLATELLATAREIRNAVTLDMSEREVEHLRRGLLRVIENIDRLGAPETIRAPSRRRRRSA